MGTWALLQQWHSNSCGGPLSLQGTRMSQSCTGGREACCHSIPPCCRLLPDAMAEGLVQAGPARWDPRSCASPAAWQGASIGKGRVRPQPVAYLSSCTRSPMTPLTSVICHFISLGEGQGKRKGTDYRHHLLAPGANLRNPGATEKLPSLC